ncbi:MAG TPA: glycosyltransferase [Chthoniobacterales bacterium]|nr:glycosyltransferase [Chthoniobacterales bacterium]
MIAFLVREMLIKIITPLTGFLQRVDLSTCSSHHCLFYSITRRLARFMSWSCQGAITLAYPSMGYHPIQARRQIAASQWTSQILGIPSAELEQNAKIFLLDIQHPTNVLSSISYLPSPAAAAASPTAAAVSPTSHLSPPTSIRPVGRIVTPTFTVLICFHHHVEFFKSCLNSIKDACAQTPEASIEILIINDDPSIDATLLLKEASQSLQEKITLHSNEHNLGICRSANHALARAKGEWILHLDCDDRLEPNVFSILEQTIQKYPAVRFISSRAIDIDEKGRILSWRLRSEKPSDLIKDNFASHLKVMRKDLHHDLGLFNRTFEGCQDYEFALRTAINEPLCFIPDYLYQYRWHAQSQTVSHNQRQNLTAARIRQTYLLAIYWLTHGTAIIHWDITGPYADSWQQKITPSTNATRYTVTFDAERPYEECLWKLLLVQVATIIIDRYREGNKNKEIFTRIEAMEGMDEGK